MPQKRFQIKLINIAIYCNTFFDIAIYRNTFLGPQYPALDLAVVVVGWILHRQMSSYRSIPWKQWTSAPCGASVHYFQGMERYSDILLYRMQDFVPFTPELWSFQLLLCNRCVELKKIWCEARSLVLYQVCVFRADRKIEMAPRTSDWLRHFQLFLCNRWMEFKEHHMKLNPRCAAPTYMWASRPFRCHAVPTYMWAFTWSAHCPFQLLISQHKHIMITILALNIVLCIQKKKTVWNLHLVRVSINEIRWFLSTRSSDFENGGTRQSESWHTFYFCYSCHYNQILCQQRLIPVFKAKHLTHFLSWYVLSLLQLSFSHM